MIAPMKKFLLVMLDKDSSAAPTQLRKLGIAHVEQFESKGESCSALESALKDAQGAKNILAANLSKKNKKPSRAGSDFSTEEIIAATLALNDELASERDKVVELGREEERIQSWGDFDPKAVAELAECGLSVALIESQGKNSPDPATEAGFIRLGPWKGKKRFALLSGMEVPEGYDEFRLPSLSLGELREAVQACNGRIGEISAELASLASWIPKIEKRIRTLQAELDIERLKAGMPADGSLRYFGGYVPASEVSALSTEASSRGWALAFSDPGPEDSPPTKVENSSFVRIIQPVFDFLGTVPGYREYDISPYFLGFFSLYFAMIFGDAGYGVLMLSGAAITFLGAKRKGKTISDFLKLIFVLSGSTVLWGLATASWFALPYDSLPGALRALSIPAFASHNPEAGTNIKIFCFVIGVIQLSIAHIKNIKRDLPHLKFLAQLGSLAMVIGMFNAVLNLVIDAKRFPLSPAALGLIGAGFALVLVFGNWNGKFFSSLLEGLKGIIPTFLGTVSVFADIVSYIRLWAVALAGLAISETLNGMVVKLLGDPAGRIGAFVLGFFFSLILLVVGHSLNFVMSVLSVVVHGIRLNMLEFSSHLGMEWTGYPYEPLAESAEDNEV